MNNANKFSCPVIVNPDPKDYDEKSRDYQGCPTIAITKKGRIFAAWYAGGFNEPHMDNYNLVHFSDDDGKTWSDMCVVIPSSKELLIHALDIQLWIDPDNTLHVFWVQNNVIKAEKNNSPEDFGKKSLRTVELMLTGTFSEIKSTPNGKLSAKIPMPTSLFFQNRAFCLMDF